MAAARVVGTVGGDRADLLVRGNLAEQVRQNGAVAVAAGGEFHGADVRSGWVHGQMDLAPLASALHPVLAGLPFATAQELDPGAVEEVIERTLNTRPTAATHWSIRSMAEVKGLSHTTIRRIWIAFGLQPHRSETFKLSTDPLFVDKVQDIVGLYMGLAEPGYRIVRG